MHKTIEPAIHYFGTPVVLITTLNKDKTVNVAPMSSIWWLGSSCMIGLDGGSQSDRVIRGTGVLSKYRWGEVRKLATIAYEASNK